MSTSHLGPTTEKERYIILDALRGLALAGIVLANLPEFALWTFLSPAEQAALPHSSVDGLVRFAQYMFIDGKFYTIFSLLFGLGFSLIIARHGKRLFCRRMAILALIGLCHMMLLWSGDILLLYATGGLLLTLFVKCSDKALLTWAAVLITVPIGLVALTEYAGIDFSAPFYRAWWRQAAAEGITEENFATWLRDAHSYPQMFAFLKQGAVERMWEFVDGHRLLKVLGLFILGYLAGKHRLYARLEELPLKKCCVWSYVLGLPISALYAWSATHSHPWSDTLNALLYTLSVTTLVLAYISTLCLLHRRGRCQRLMKWVAAPGRMALTNYIGHSVAGIIIFYGFGFGLGASMNLALVELTALGIFILQVVLSRAWLQGFRFGPLEWLWRMLTYGRYFPIRKGKESE